MTDSKSKTKSKSQTEEISGTQGSIERDKVIVCVHGGGSKPESGVLLDFWRASLRAGLVRDAKGLLSTFDDLPMEMVYFADRAEHADEHFDVSLDTLQRRQVLEQLSQLKSAKDFRRRYYEQLPGKTPLKEFAMDTAAALGVGGLALAKAMPVYKSYWADENGWASDVQADLQRRLTGYLNSGRDVLLLTHCLGSVLAYDVLSDMRQEAEHATNRVQMWLTMGSPLAAKAVTSQLHNAQISASKRYPNNIVQWHNVAAEDDYVCHDKTVSDDFRGMLDHRLIGGIEDHVIYNLSVRYGRSNPHHSAGYLIHPRVTKLLQKWLSAGT